MAAWLGGCQRRIGFAHSWRQWLLTDSLRMTRGPNGKRVPTPVLLDYNRLVQAAGCGDPGHDLQLFTSTDDEAVADVAWHRLGLRSPVVALNPGAAFGAAKHWPEDHFAHVARRLATERGAQVLVLGGPSECDAARRIAATAGTAGVVALADADVPLSLGLTKSLVRRCDLLITTDSGPRHFAHAFDRPVVTLFGPTHIAWTETFHPRAVHMQKPVPCGPCQQRVCPQGHHQCMVELQPDNVFATALRLLDRAADEEVRRVG
jgi:heptosyltransferase-2